jgi:hypothetical protein
LRPVLDRLGVGPTRPRQPIAQIGDLPLVDLDRNGVSASINGLYVGYRARAGLLAPAKESRLACGAIPSRRQHR